jgi:H+/Cl- antiporter ClcA
MLTTVLQRLEMLACACAAGVAAAFGSAFGATLFSLEVSCSVDTKDTIIVSSGTVASCNHAVSIDP